jgi:hypothetical protein
MHKKYFFLLDTVQYLKYYHMFKSGRGKNNKCSAEKNNRILKTVFSLTLFFVMPYT